MILPFIYFDTNIIIDLLNDRNQFSIDLFEKMKDHNWKGIISYFVLMEALGIQQELHHVRNKMKEKERLDKICEFRHYKELTKTELEDEYKRMYTILKPYFPNLEFWHLTDKGWVSALDIMTRINITAIDAIHVATAIESHCRFFVSNDSKLLKNTQGMFKGLTPQKMVKYINDNPNFPWERQ